MHVADRGPCPNSTCPVGDVCDVQLTGEFYCKCAGLDCEDRPVELELDRSDDELYALFVIPAVVIIILLVLLVIVYRRRRVIKKTVCFCVVNCYSFLLLSVL